MRTHVDKKDMSGTSVFRWSVIKYVGKGYYLCRCECGSEKNVYGSNLRKGSTKSCGCYGLEVAGVANKTHGLTKSRTYRIWSAMKVRCYRKSSKDYANWGGRGIRVCDRWHSFENFLLDMGEARQGMSIDRINNDGDYEPGNCRWVGCEIQARNTRSNVVIEWRGEKKCVSEWAESIGVPVKALRRRLRLGWSVDDAFTLPLHIGQVEKLIEHNGKRQGLVAWANELGIKKTTLLTRIKRGWSIERALTC